MKQLIAIVLMFGVLPAKAATQVFNSETAFLQATSITHFDSFEDEALTGAQPSITTTNFTMSVSPLAPGYSSFAVVSNALNWATDGTHIVGGGGDPWRLDFSLDFYVTAIGFDVLSASEAPTQSGEQSVVRFDLPSGEQFVMSSCPPCLQVPDELDKEDYFFGIVSDTPFNTFSITNTAWSDGVAFDRMQFTAAAAVPIPAAVWLFGSGLGLLGWVRRSFTVRDSQKARDA